MGFNVLDVSGIEKALTKIAKKYPPVLELVESFFESVEGLEEIEELDNVGEHVPGLNLKEIASINQGWRILMLTRE